jgi:hypothetical protein
VAKRDDRRTLRGCQATEGDLSVGGRPGLCDRVSLGDGVSLGDVGDGVRPRYMDVAKVIPNQHPRATSNTFGAIERMFLKGV